MLYTKDIDDIRWEDVDDFCQQGIQENAYLDYKMDFPSSLEKTISAMANAMGGLIIIGIEEDNENKPKLPISGIPFKKGLSEKVMNIVLSNITPPLFPEIQVCRDKTGKKAIVVIRIPQSHKAPHAIKNNTRVYLRTGDLNNPEEPATIDNIWWLKDGRNKSIELRKSIIEQTQDRYSYFYERELEDISTEGERMEEALDGILTLSIGVTYPHHIFLSPPELEAMVKDFTVSDYYGTRHSFPFGFHIPVVVRDGVVLKDIIDDRLLYTEINSFGYYFFRQPLKIKDNRIIRASEILARIDLFIGSSLKFFQKLGYWGFLNFNIWISNIRGYSIAFDWFNRFPHDTPIGTSPDGYITYSDTFLVKTLEDQRDKILRESSKRIFWGFNLDFSEGQFSQFDKIRN